jgi:hypothetical protein
MSTGRITDDPNAVVDGQTIVQWAENWVKWAFPQPFDPNAPNALNDPTGSIAAEFNSPSSQMYFITGDLSENTRTFNIQAGQDVLVPVNAAEDSEGPGIAPSLPRFPGTPAQAVWIHLHQLYPHFTGQSATLDGTTVKPLPILNSGIFDAGVVQAGSLGQAVVGGATGASLQYSGVAGNWVVLSNLSVGQHIFTDSSGHTDILAVGATS